MLNVTISAKRLMSMALVSALSFLLYVLPSFTHTAEAAERWVDKSSQFTIKLLNPIRSRRFTYALSPIEITNLGETLTGKHRVVLTSLWPDNLTFEGSDVDAEGTVFFPFNDEVISGKKNIITLKAIEAYAHSFGYQVQVQQLEDDSNSAPIITSKPVVEIVWPNKYQYVVTAIDKDEDPITFELLEGPINSVINPITGIIDWSTEDTNQGQYDFSVKVSDDKGTYDIQTFTLSLIAPNNFPPTITSMPKVLVDYSEQYLYQVTATDLDDDELIYSLNHAPQNMSIDSQTGLIKWNATQHEIGYHLIKVLVSDGSEFDEQIYNIQVVASDNTAPEIISVAPLEAIIDNLYSYQLVAIDAENDILNYELIEAPTGMLIDGATGLISWLAEGALSNVSITAIVTDPSGLFDTQNYTLHISSTPNTAPEITSIPQININEYSDYSYKVTAIDKENDKLTYHLSSAKSLIKINTGSGLLTWDNIDIPVQGTTINNEYCEIIQDTSTRVSGVADVFIVVDESGSMSGEHTWISDLVPALEGGLASVGVGQEESNLYGLVGYEGSPRFFSFESDYMHPSENFDSLANQLSLYGGTEDGYRAMSEMLDTYPIRTGSSKNLILVTDEDRDTTATIDYDSMKAKLVSNNVILNAVVNSNFSCADGTSALGMSAGGLGYVADGQGGYYLCTEAYAHGASGQTIDDYVELALDTGGAAWDLNFLRSGGIRAQSFSKALVDIKIKEIIEQLPPILQIDLQANDIEVNEQVSGVVSISTKIFNRGLADTTHEYSVSFYSKGELLGVTSSSGLVAGHKELIVLTDISESAIGEEVSVLITSGNDECLQNNNLATAAAIKVKALDTLNAEGNQWFTVNVIGENTKPILFDTENFTLAVGEEFTYQLSASDENVGDSISFSLIDAPVGMKINPSNGVIEWQPTQSDIGNISVVAVVTDLSGLQASIEIDFDILDILKAPIIVSDPILNAQIGASYYYQVIAQSDRNAEIYYQLINAPKGMFINENTGEITWRPTELTQDGGHTVIVEAVDDKNLTAIQTFNITAITSGAAAEFISSPNSYLELGETFNYIIEVTEPLNGSIDVVVQQAPDGLVFNAENNTVMWLPDVAGLYPIQIMATTEGGLQSFQRFQLQVVQERNLPPIITSQAFWTVEDDGALSYQVIANDPEGDDLAYQLVSAPEGIIINDQGLVTWPKISQLDGQFTVRLKVTDGAGIFSEQIFNFSFYPHNNIPFITSQPTGVSAVNVTYLYSLIAQDQDGDLITFSLEEAPVGAHLVNSNEIEWTPSSEQLGTQNFVIKVVDSFGAYSLQSFNVTVLEVLNNESPVVTSTPIFEAFSGQLYRYQVIAADPDNNQLTYRLIDMPSNMNIDNTGLISWQPDVNNEGANSVKLRVFDSYGAYAEQVFNITVNVGGKPVITSTPILSAYHDLSYLYQVNVVDIDDVLLNYRLIKAPAGMVIDEQGLVSWEPNVENIGEQLITIEVSDSVNNKDVQSFNLLVKYQGDSEAPVIDSSPKLVAITEEIYSYQVIAFDPDGDLLQYHLLRSPEGMTIDNNGLLEWLANEEAVGMNDVEIEVSDITGQSTIQTFRLMTTAPGKFNRRVCRIATSTVE
jgi:hypothetical protein